MKLCFVLVFTLISFLENGFGQSLKNAAGKEVLVNIYSSKKGVIFAGEDFNADFICRLFEWHTASNRLDADNRNILKNFLLVLIPNDFWVNPYKQNVENKRIEAILTYLTANEDILQVLQRDRDVISKAESRICGFQGNVRRLLIETSKWVACNILYDINQCMYNVLNISIIRSNECNYKIGQSGEYIIKIDLTPVLTDKAGTKVTWIEERRDCCLKLKVTSKLKLKKVKKNFAKKQKAEQSQGDLFCFDKNEIELISVEF